MILYYTCRQEPSIIITREASSSTGQEQIKRPTATYQAEVRESCKRGGGRILEGRCVKDTSTGLTESTNLTQSHGGSQTLNRHSGSPNGFRLMVEQLGVLMGCLTVGGGSASVVGCCLYALLPQECPYSGAFK